MVGGEYRRIKRIATIVLTFLQARYDWHRLVSVLILYWTGFHADHQLASTT